MARKRVTLSAVVRNAVLERDRHQCRHCGSLGPLEVDHIIPLAQEGSNDLSNLQILCRPCNRQKRAKTDPKFNRRFC